MTINTWAIYLKSPLPTPDSYYMPTGSHSTNEMQFLHNWRQVPVVRDESMSAKDVILEGLFLIMQLSNSKRLLSTIPTAQAFFDSLIRANTLGWDDAMQGKHLIYKISYKYSTISSKTRETHDFTARHEHFWIIFQNYLFNFCSIAAVCHFPRRS